MVQNQPQSGKWFNALHYEVDKETGLIDYESVEKIASRKKTKTYYCRR